MEKRLKKRKERDWKEALKEIVQIPLTQNNYESAQKNDLVCQKFYRVRGQGSDGLYNIAGNGHYPYTK